MNMDGKTDAVLEWLKTYQPLNELLKLNAIKAEDGDASMSTVFSDDEGKPFIDGTARREYTFMLKLMLPWSDGHDKVNVDADKAATQWRDWVSNQYPSNIPEWDCEIDDIRALYNVPAVTVYQDESLAEYNFQARITYTE